MRIHLHSGPEAVDWIMMVAGSLIAACGAWLVAIEWHSFETLRHMRGIDLPPWDSVVLWVLRGPFGLAAMAGTAIAGIGTTRLLRRRALHRRAMREQVKVFDG